MENKTIGITKPREKTNITTTPRSTADISEVWNQATEPVRMKVSKATADFPTQTRLKMIPVRRGTLFF